MTIFVDCIGISKRALRASFGIYRYVINLLTGIKREKYININFKIIIVKQDIESYNFLLDDHRFEIITIDKDITNNLDYFNVLKNDLKNIVEKRDYPVFFPRGYFLCNIKNKKIIIVHDTIPYYFWKKNHNIKSLFIWQKIKDSIRKSDKVIFISTTTYANVLNLYKNKDIFNKVNILYNGIELNTFEYLREEQDTKDYFLTFYSKHKHKGYDKVLKAFSIYRENGGNNKLYVIGASSNYFDEKNSIKYITYLNDIELYKLYRDCRGFISLSEIEGFGYPVMEAAYWGVPVILSSIPVYYEILSYYDNTYFTSCFDIKNIVEQLFNSQKNFKIVDFKDYVDKEYSLLRFAKNFDKILKK